MHATFLRLLQLSPRTTGGRLILLGYGFLVFILANLYIASMSAILSARSERSDIEGMEDLVNRPVGIFVDDRTVFQRFVLNVCTRQGSSPATCSLAHWVCC